jgi:predicted ATPase
MALAQRFVTLAEKQPDRNDPLIGGRLIGVSQHYLGDQSSARRRLEHMLAHYLPSAQKSHIIRFQSDQRAMARAHLALILWLQGLPDQAVRAAKSSIEDARAANHANSLCHTLAVAACAIALLIGDLAAAEHYAEVLLDHATRHALAHWRAFGRSYQGALAIARGDVIKGLPLLHAGVNDRGKAGLVAVSTSRLIGFLMAEALGRAGQVAGGLAVIEEALASAESTGERWAISEVLRLKGELLLLQGAPGAAAAARIISGKRSTGRIGRKPCPGNSERPRVSRGFGESNIALRKRARCWGRFTLASPKVSRRQTYERRRAFCRN